MIVGITALGALIVLGLIVFTSIIITVTVIRRKKKKGTIFL